MVVALQETIRRLEERIDELRRRNSSSREQRRSGSSREGCWDCSGRLRRCCCVGRHGAAAAAAARSGEGALERHGLREREEKRKKKLSNFGEASSHSLVFFLFLSFERRRCLLPTLQRSGLMTGPPLLPRTQQLPRNSPLRAEKSSE